MISYILQYEGVWSINLKADLEVDRARFGEGGHYSPLSSLAQEVCW